MPSSTSSSEQTSSAQANSGHAPAPGLRLTASDRPGVAQPVPERDIPDRPWAAIMMSALLLGALLLCAWEWQWRAYGATPGYRNSDGAWAEQRRRIDSGEGDSIVILGSSRLLFDVNLPVWQRVNGERPIQLALEGTSPMRMLEDLADDSAFRGRLVVGVTPGLFFAAREARGNLVDYYHHQAPSQRSGHWLSQRMEPYFAFYDSDFSLANVISRMHWPQRAGLRGFPPVRKISTHDIDRNTRMWQKVEVDADYSEMVRMGWMARLAKAPPDMDTPEKAQKIVDAQIARAVAAVEKLRARGAQVVFVRAPSIGPLYEAEERDLPREATWALLLARTGAPGVHFMDHPELQGFVQPEWSHLSADDAARFTEQLAPIVQRAFVPE